MTKEEFYMTDAKDIYSAIGFIPKELRKDIYINKVPERVFNGK
jgi:hypothetical protein